MLSLDQLLSQYSASILFECIAGSRAYGTTNNASDEDRRGIFAVSASAYLDLVRPPDQVGDERGNNVFYTLRRVIELLAQANPNILELLYMPDDCVLRSSPEMQMLIEHRAIFITRKCPDTHAGYAMSQIKKARGQNKWINNPKPSEPPKKEDYCYIIPWSTNDANARPSRPVSLSKIGWPLNEYHLCELWR